jgi:uncharacterized protein YndB with AHSA1/START domain
VRLASCDRVIEASVDIVWRLVSTADGLSEWMCEEAMIDLRVGGVITWRHANGWVVAGEIREIVPMRRLVFTYGWAEGGFPVPLGSSVVTMELTAVGGSTALSIRHAGLADEMAEQHTGGWTMFADVLTRRAEVVARGGVA